MPMNPVSFEVVISDRQFAVICTPVICQFDLDAIQDTSSRQTKRTHQAVERSILITRGANCSPIVVRRVVLGLAACESTASPCVIRVA